MFLDINPSQTISSILIPLNTYLSLQAPTTTTTADEQLQRRECSTTFLVDNLAPVIAHILMMTISDEISTKATSKKSMILKKYIVYAVESVGVKCSVAMTKNAD
jgi:hypothetical protein